MIYTCIYDNIPAAGGYGIHAKSPGFPIQYEKEIQKVSRCFGPGNGSTETMAIRYAPVREEKYPEEKYLLSWILRHPLTYTDGQRAWHTVVHFLMDEQDADALFRHPISTIADRTVQVAGNLWKNGKSMLPEDVQFFSEAEPGMDIKDANGQIDDCILLAGAFYCAREGRTYQMFLDAQDPWGELDFLQKWLPYALRKDLSFCVGLQNQQESEGIILNFPTDTTLHQLHDAQGEGTPMSDKYWQGQKFSDSALYEDCNLILSHLEKCAEPLQELIFNVVSGWCELRMLAVSDLSDGLGALIKHTSQEPWTKALHHAKMNVGELQRLAEIIPRKRYTQTLHKELSRRLARLTPAKPDETGPSKEAAKAHNEDSEEITLKKILMNQALRGTAVIVIVVVLIALITMARQVLMHSTVEVEQTVYYCISQEAAADVLKLAGAFLCGVLLTLASIGLVSSFKRKE